MFTDTLEALCVSISHANAVECNDILRRLGVAVVPQGLPPAKDPAKPVFFKWSDDLPEPDQASGEQGYLVHIKKLFLANTRDLDIVGVEKWRGENSLWQLKLADGTELRGTSDAAIYLRGQQPGRVGHLQSLLRDTAVVYFEVGKPVTTPAGLFGKKEAQAKLEAVCARLTASTDAMCPIVVVTDLQEEWTVLWLQPNDAGTALELVVSAGSPAEVMQVVCSACRVAEGPISEDLPPLTALERRRRANPASNADDPLQKRFKPLPKPDIANLEDIADLMTHEDIIGAYAQHLRASFPAQFSMYA